MVQRVLVPIDDSEQADLAFDYALREFPEGSITVLHVLDPPSTGYRTGEERGAQSAQSAYQQEVTEGTAFLDEYITRGETAGRTISKDHAVAYERGREARAIIDYAEDHDVDHIVLGSHGRTGVSRILLGSVAENVIRRSPVPVTVVR